MHRNEPRDRALQHRRLPQPESIGQLRVEDVDHLSIAVIDAGKLLHAPAPRAARRQVGESPVPARASGPPSAVSAKLLIYRDRTVDSAQVG
jgi:hypothetical protein